MKPLEKLLAQERLSPFPEFDKLEVSHSSRGSLASCPRKIEFRKMYNSSRRDETQATGSGKAMHEAFQTWLVNKDVDEGLWKLVSNYPIQFQKTAMDANSLEGCIGTYLHCIQSELFNEWEIAYVIKPDGEKVPAVEVPFNLRMQVDFFNTGRLVWVNYIGYIDLIMYNKIEDRYAVWDIKTTTREADFATQFTFDEQCLPYGLVLQKLLGLDYERGYDVGYWITKLHVVEPYEVLLTFTKDGHDVAEWLRGYLLDIHMLQMYHRLGFFPRHGGSCSSWNRRCQFFDMCDTRDYNYLETMIGMENINLECHNRPEPWVVIDLGVSE